MLKKIFSFLGNHKIIVGLIIIGLGVGAYYLYGYLTATPQTNKYVIGQAAKGSLISSTSGTGQISASKQVEIKPPANGEILSVNVNKGDPVSEGDIIATIDDDAAQSALEDAKSALESAQLTYNKLTEPPDSYSLTQAKNAIAQAEESKIKAESDLARSYQNAYGAVADAFLNLPDIIANLDSILNDDTISSGKKNINYYGNAIENYNSQATQYRSEASKSLIAAKKAYDQNFSDYKKAGRTSDAATIEALAEETKNTTQTITDALINASDLINYYHDILNKNSATPTEKAAVHLATLNQLITKIDQSTAGITASETSLANSKNSITASETSLAEKNHALELLIADPEETELRVQELAVRQKERALEDAREAVDKYTVRAPFNGKISSLEATAGDTASANTIIATIVTEDLIATITLNETNIIGIEVGQKATFAFDAVEDLTLTGKVIAVDNIGTVTQGVVNYTVTLSIDTQDKRLKPGMSATVAIITSSIQDVLIVPNSAIKSGTNGSYVLMPDEEVDSGKINNTSGITLEKASKQQTVSIGSANDSYTEITSGLKEGDYIITKTISPSSTSTSKNTNSSSSSLFNIGGSTGSQRDMGGMQGPPSF